MQSPRSITLKFSLPDSIVIDLSFSTTATVRTAQDILSKKTNHSPEVIALKFGSMPLSEPNTRLCNAGIKNDDLIMVTFIGDVIRFNCKNNSYPLQKDDCPTLEKARLLLVPKLKQYLSEDDTLLFFINGKQITEEEYQDYLIMKNVNPIDIEIPIIPKQGIKYQFMIEGNLAEHYFAEEATYEDANRYIENRLSIDRRIKSFKICFGGRYLKRENRLLKKIPAFNPQEDIIQVEVEYHETKDPKKYSNDPILIKINQCPIDPELLDPTPEPSALLSTRSLKNPEEEDQANNNDEQTPDSQANEENAQDNEKGEEPETAAAFAAQKEAEALEEQKEAANEEKEEEAKQDEPVAAIPPPDEEIDPGMTISPEEEAAGIAQAEAEEKAAAEAAPAEEAPAEEAPTEEAPTEEAPTEEAPTEEAPTEEAQVEEAPAEEAPTEEAPAVEAPTEEAPVEEEKAAEANPDESAAVPPPAEEAAPQAKRDVILPNGNRIYFFTYNDEKFELEFEPGATVKDAVMKIAEKYDVPDENIDILFAGKFRKPESTLKELNVPKRGKITVFITSTEAILLQSVAALNASDVPRSNEYLIILPDNTQLDVDFTGEEQILVKDIKAKVAEQVNQNAELISLISDGKLLSDDIDLKSLDLPLKTKIAAHYVPELIIKYNERKEQCKDDDEREELENEVMNLITPNEFKKLMKLKPEGMDNIDLFVIYLKCGKDIVATKANIAQ